MNFDQVVEAIEKNDKMFTVCGRPVQFTRCSFYPNTVNVSFRYGAHNHRVDHFGSAEYREDGWYYLGFFQSKMIRIKLGMKSDPLYKDILPIKMDNLKSVEDLIERIARLRMEELEKVGREFVNYLDN
jgi:hypothetical protein